MPWNMQTCLSYLPEITLATVPRLRHLQRSPFLRLQMLHQLKTQISCSGFLRNHRKAREIGALNMPAKRGA